MISPAGRVLPAGFYRRPVEEVAADMLGAFVVREVDGVVVGGRIVEVEAYGGPGDPGSHAHRAPAGRARIMFGPPGIAYVYFTYGMHHCLNAVTQPEGQASAVLLRALEPVWGADMMRAAGAPASLSDAKLASGPGRLCRALRIDRRLNGHRLTRRPLSIRAGDPVAPIHAGTRVGLTADDGRTWRFWTPSPAVSRSGTGSTGV